MPIRPAPQTATAYHALVTEASSDISRATTECLLADGWCAAGLCRTAPIEPVEGLEIARVDVMDFTRLGKVCDGLGTVDALVHAVDSMYTAPLGVLCAAGGAAMWRVHVDAAAFLADRLMLRMSAGDRTLLIGSHTVSGAPTCSQCAATKTALVGMVRSWVAELAPRGITVNVIAPGATDTPFLYDPTRAHTPPRMPPIGRSIVSKEMTAMAAFQAGECGGAITGQQIMMCDGASLQRWRVVRRSRQSGADARWPRRVISLAILASRARLYPPIYEWRRSLDPP